METKTEIMKTELTHTPIRSMDPHLVAGVIGGELSEAGDEFGSWRIITRNPTVVIERNGTYGYDPVIIEQLGEGSLDHHVHQLRGSEVAVDPEQKQVQIHEPPVNLNNGEYSVAVTTFSRSQGLYSRVLYVRETP